MWESRFWNIPKLLLNKQNKQDICNNHADEHSASMVGLRDLCLSGWLNNDTGELFTGIKITDQDTVVDVGCGDGGFLSFCARKGANVIGIDQDNAALLKAQHRMISASNAFFINSSVERLPICDNIASVIICTEVLEHIVNPAQAMEEIKRICRPGGSILISVPDPLQEYVQEKVAPKSYFEIPNHINIFERDFFGKLVTDAGLKIVSRSQFGFFWSVWWAMFWSCEVNLDHPQHPALDFWTAAWDHLLSSKDGIKVKAALDQAMPKSQVIHAMKQP